MRVVAVIQAGAERAPLVRQAPEVSKAAAALAAQASSRDFWRNSSRRLSPSAHIDGSASNRLSIAATSSSSTTTPFNQQGVTITPNRTPLSR